ncbi:MAG: preprotein translocase subunit SecE [Mycoplasmoidaceae bacterium]
MKKKDKNVKPDKKLKKEKIVNENKKNTKEKVFKLNKNKLKKDNELTINDDLIIAKDKSDIKVDQIKIEKDQIEVNVEQKNEFKVSNESKKSNQSEVNYKDEKKHKGKRLFFGLGKEFWRISWPTNKKIINDFITTVIVMTFFTLIFYGVGVLIAAFIK